MELGAALAKVIAMGLLYAFANLGGSVINIFA